MIFNLNSSSLLSKGLSVALVRVVGLVSVVLVNSVLARQLSHDDFGLFLLLRSITSFGAILAMCGLDSLLVRFLGQALGVGDVAGAFAILKLAGRITLLAFLVASLLGVVFLASVGSDFFQISMDVPFIALIIAVTISLASVQLIAETLRAFSKVATASFLGGQNGGPASNVALICAVPIIAWSCKLELRTVLFIYFGSLFLTAVGSAALLGRTLLGIRRDHEIQDEFDNDSGRKLMHACLPVMFSQMLTFVVNQADIWIAGSTLTHDELALFGAARRLTLLVAVPMDMLNLTIVAAIPQLLARGDHSGLQRMIRSSTQVAAIPSLIAIGLFIAAPKWTLTVFYGESYQSAAMILCILSAGQLAMSCCGPCGITLMMAGYQNVMLAINSFFSLLLFVGGIAGSRHYGMVGLAVVSSATIVLQRVAMCYLTGRLTGLWTYTTLPWSTSKAVSESP